MYVNPKHLFRSEDEEIVFEPQPASLVHFDRIKNVACEMQCLMKIIGGLWRCEIRPDEIEDLFAVHAAVWRKRQEFDQRARLTPSPFGVLYSLRSECDTKCSKELDAYGHLLSKRRSTWHWQPHLFLKGNGLLYEIALSIRLERFRAFPNMLTSSIAR